MTYYKAGTWNCICAVCGRMVKSDEIIKRWDGVLVCKEDFEVRHIMDFIRPTAERSSVPFTAPEATDTFITVPYIQFGQGLADIGGADIALSDVSLPGLQ